MRNVGELRPDLCGADARRDGFVADEVVGCAWREVWGKDDGGLG